MSEQKAKGFAENPPIIRLEKITIEKMVNVMNNVLM
jgi:hypothetical protein